MKNLIIPLFVATAVLLGGCRKDMDRLNVNTKQARNVPGEMLFSNAQKNLADILTTPNVNNNVFEFIVQYWSATTYPQESRYDLGNRNIPQNWWTIIYRDVLSDLNEAQRLIAAEQPLLEEEQVAQRNKLAIVQLTKAHAFYVLVNTFGDIPYSEALDIENTTPAYDKQRTIYYSLLDSVEDAIADMDVSGESFGSADLIYNGDMNLWFKFANSLQLRFGMLIADVDYARASELVETAAPNVIQSNMENAVFRYQSNPPNTNPIWTNLVQSNRNDYVPSNTLINAMNALDDPRRDEYFTEGPNGGYVGGIYGAGNTFGNFSHMGDQTLEPDFPSVLMDYAEVEFLLAEAVERGMNVGGTAAQHYNNGVRASILYWDGSETEATTYLARPDVNYATAPGTYKEKIGRQLWIAMYLRSFDEWVHWRRLDAPALVKPASAISDIPVRYTYPFNEQNLNEANYNAASESIGGDAVTTRLFWDVN
ncbi:MAG: SusD/RagB family nutrient-binding outer membrane lipoprotein [Pedobacter sp.]|nr:MAG: SusD/RagB family nutrient-binding outer membrane lipoprotein [Pedobacter sp.]